MKKNSNKINVTRKGRRVKVEIITVGQPCQISEEERERRAQLRIENNHNLVNSYPVGSYIRKRKGVRQRIVGIQIDINHFDRPTFTVVSMKTMATKYLMGDKIEAYSII